MSSLDYQLTKGSSLGLDLVRGVSAQLVVVGHGISFFGVAKFLHEPNFPWMQNIAVLTFFLVSGFLIPYSVALRLGRQDDYSATHFLIDRFSRIYVPFVAALVFVLCLDSLSRQLSPDSYRYSAAFDIRTFVGNLLMLQDHTAWRWFDGRNITSFGSARPFWTLAVEWWIYLFFGFVTLVLFKTKRSWLAKIVFGGMLSIVPIHNLVSGRGNGLTAYWLFGGVVYLLLASNRTNTMTRGVQASFTLVAFGLGMWRAYLEMDAYDPIFAFLLALAMWQGIELCRDVDFSKLATKMISALASYSYTLYLIHYSILDFIKVHVVEEGWGRPWASFFLAFAISNVLAFLIGRWVEGPLTRQVKAGLYLQLKQRRSAQAVAG